MILALWKIAQSILNNQIVNYDLASLLLGRCTIPNSQKVEATQNVHQWMDNIIYDVCLRRSCISKHDISTQRKEEWPSTLGLLKSSLLSSWQ
jgi:hypothetical protein